MHPTVRAPASAATVEQAAVVAPEAEVAPGVAAATAGHLALAVNPAQVARADPAASRGKQVNPGSPVNRVSRGDLAEALGSVQTLSPYLA
jgi:hypothetical protein